MFEFLLCYCCNVYFSDSLNVFSAQALPFLEVNYELERDKNSEISTCLFALIFLISLWSSFSHKNSLISPSMFFTEIITILSCLSSPSECQPWRTALNREWSWKALTRNTHPCTSSSLWLRWVRHQLMDISGDHSAQHCLLQLPFFCLIMYQPGLWLPASAPFWWLLWLPRLLGEC